MLLGRELRRAAEVVLHDRAVRDRKVDAEEHLLGADPLDAALGETELLALLVVAVRGRAPLDIIVPDPLGRPHLVRHLGLVRAARERAQGGVPGTRACSAKERARPTKRGSRTP